MLIRFLSLQLFLAFAVANARNDPPPSSDRTWLPPNLANYEGELAGQRFNNAESTSRVSINPRKIYGLAELIDIAERNNPATRVAWERARQAAAAVGLSESAYYPFLAASAAAGYDRAFIPFPTLMANPKHPSLNNVQITGGGSLVTEAQVYRGELTAKWLLLDFGERSATVAAAREQLMMANVGFNGTHQKIVFQVTDRFYQLGTARQKVLVAQSALDAAQTVEEAVQARIDNGLATQPELLQARQQSAQSAFDVDAATGVESDARVALVESIGILPTVPLHIADLSESSTSEQANGSVNKLIARALSQRPDLVAKLANVYAKQDEIKKVRAEYYPHVVIDAHVTETDLEVSIAHSDYFGDTKPTVGVFLTASVPIFDGFGRRHKMEMAEAELHGAENELAGARDSAVREVWKAYIDFKTALRKQDSAAKLVTASQNAFDAVLESYKNGLSTYPEIVSAQRNLASARSVSHDTQAAIFTTATELALSTGDLARPSARPLRPSAVRPLQSSPRAVRPLER
ncbi:MAG TPA: TolC family protein [Chthoniobacterales bacterium]|jgi:outer membrane protein|nr:TolC family protein [Chthoniobacterales bacterium]